MKKKFMSVLILLLITTLTLTPFTSAFNDTKGVRGEKHIHKLKERGIIKGANKGMDNFKPKDHLTYAQAAVLFDEAFELSLAHIKFIKEPKLSDVYKNTKDNQWYSQAMLEAYYNGVQFAENVNPNSPISREEFAYHLITQLDKKADYSIIEIYISYDDEDKVNSNYKNAIQKLLILKFEELDKKNKFNPQKPITREDAAIWLENVLEFIDEYNKNQAPINVLSDIVVKRESVSTQVDKVSINLTVPHPGYSAQIKQISFNGDYAYITLEQINPNPNMMYPQVITTITLDTFVAAKYKIEVLTQ